MEPQGGSLVHLNRDAAAPGRIQERVHAAQPALGGVRRLEGALTHEPLAACLQRAEQALEDGLPHRAERVRLQAYERPDQALTLAKGAPHLHGVELQGHEEGPAVKGILRGAGQS